MTRKQEFDTSAICLTSKQRRANEVEPKATADGSMSSRAELFDDVVEMRDDDEDWYRDRKDNSEPIRHI